MRIFISYRREDAAGYAGRLCDSLRERFGADAVFIDVDGIRPGDDFAEAIERTLRQCDVLIAVIGPHWTSVKNGDGRPRLFDEGDFVRLEVESALAIELRTVPVLVGRATMPDRSTVPESLWPLLRRQAVELADSGWSDDVRSLLDGLAATAPAAGAHAAARASRRASISRPGAPAAGRPAPQRARVPAVRRAAWLAAALLALVAAVAAATALQRAGEPPADEEVPEAATATPDRAGGDSADRPAAPPLAETRAADEPPAAVPPQTAAEPPSVDPEPARPTPSADPEVERRCRALNERGSLGEKLTDEERRFLIRHCR